MTQIKSTDGRTFNVRIDRLSSGSVFVVIQHADSSDEVVIDADLLPSEIKYLKGNKARREQGMGISGFFFPTDVLVAAAKLI